jgi:hypothetical protein
MSDYTDLQKAAAYAAQDTIKFADEDEEMRALQQFHEEVDPEAVLALIAESARLRSAAKTLERLGYRDNGGELWKPPLGQKPDFSLMDQLKAENEALRSVLQEAADELRELKASVGFRGHTLAVLQRIDAAMGKGGQS